MHFGTATLITPPLSHDPMFLVEYDSSGNYVQSMSLASGADDMCAVSTDTKGNLLIATDFVDTIAFGHDTLYSLGSENLYVAKYNYNTNPCPQDQPNAVPGIEELTDVLMYPNPAFDKYYIRSNMAIPANSNVELYDLTGRLLSSSQLQQGITTLSLNGIAPGTYLCKVNITGNKTIIHRLVIAQ